MIAVAKYHGTEFIPKVLRLLIGVKNEADTNPLMQTNVNQGSVKPMAEKKQPENRSFADDLKKEDRAKTRELFISLASVYISWVIIIGASDSHLFLPVGLVGGVALTATGFLSFLAWRLLVTTFLEGWYQEERWWQFPVFIYGAISVVLCFSWLIKQ